MAIKRPLSKELMDYAGNIFPNLKANPAFAQYNEDADSNEPSDLGIEAMDSEEELIGDLPSLEESPQLDSGSEDLAKAREGADRLAQMMEQNVRDTAEYEKLKKQIESGEGGLEPLETNEEADQAELEAQEMKNIEARSKQMKEDWQKAGQEKELDAFMDAKMQEDKLPKRAPSYEEKIMEATKEKQKKEDMYDLWEQAASGVKALGLTPNTAMFDKMRKKAGRPLENLMLEKQLEQQKIERDAKNVALGQQMEDAKAKNDPNSDISKFTRQSLIDLGMKSLEEYPNISYNQLKDKYPNLIQALYTQISAKARVSAAMLSAKSNQIKMAQDMQKFKEAQEFKNKELQQRKEIADVQANLKEKGIDVSKEIKEQAAEANRQNREFTKGMSLDKTADTKLQKMYKDTDYEAYSKADESVDELDELIARKVAGESVKIPEGAAFFKYAKIAQGDSSVVRESDIRNLAGGTDFTNYINQLKAKLRGQQFTVKDLEEMKKVVAVVKRIKKEKVYQRHVKPIRTWADKYQYDLSNNVGSELLDDIDAEYRAAEERKKKLSELKNKARSKNKQE